MTRTMLSRLVLMRVLVLKQSPDRVVATEFHSRKAAAGRFLYFTTLYEVQRA